ncbi:glycosyltransferase family 2 protein [Desulfovibrio piger]
MTPPQISIILPVYNAKQYLEASVYSILNQSLTDFELILINDGSTDGSEKIVRQLAARDSRIRLVQRPNKGLIATLNEGISLARSPFIARMDADDIALPHRLERQCTYLKIHPEAVAVGSYVKLMDECGHTYRTKYLPTGEKLRKAFLWGCPIMHPTVMMRTEAVRKAGGYSPEFPSAEDYALWLRLLSLGEIDNIHEALLSYRVHGSSISHVHARQQRDSTLRAQALWIAGRTFDKDLCHLPTNPLLNALALPPETLRYLLARMLSLNSHIIGVSPKQDPDAQEWLPRILQGPMTPEIRKAMALYHLRAARAPGLSTSARLYQIARCACYSPREFMGKLGEFLRGRLQRR